MGVCLRFEFFCFWQMLYRLLCPERFLYQLVWVVIMCSLWDTRKTRLSLTLCDCRSSMVSLMSLSSVAVEASWDVREVTEHWRDLFYSASVVTCSWLNSRSCNCWNSLWSTLTRAILTSSPESILLIESKISLISVHHALPGELCFSWWSVCRQNCLCLQPFFCCFHGAVNWNIVLF